MQTDKQTGQPVVINLANPQLRKAGIAPYQEGMAWLGIKSRTTALKKERQGLIPKRIDLGNGRVGWRWGDLYAWSDNLKAAEDSTNV